MPLTKADIIQHIIQGTGLPRRETHHTVECLSAIMKDTLADGEDVLISGFGKFCVKEKSRRVGGIRQRATR
jgi:integration host factor subunit alpha